MINKVKIYCVDGSILNRQVDTETERISVDKETGVLYLSNPEIGKAEWFNKHYWKHVIIKEGEENNDD